MFLIVGAITLLFSTVATSNFLPLALSVGIYFGGHSTEAVRYFLQTRAGQESLRPVARVFGQAVYWILPNFSAFDLKAQIVYSVAMHAKGLLLTQLYGLAYLGVLLLSDDLRSDPRFREMLRRLRLPEAS